MGGARVAVRASTATQPPLLIAQNTAHASQNPMPSAPKPSLCPAPADGCAGVLELPLLGKDSLMRSSNSSDHRPSAPFHEPSLLVLAAVLGCAGTPSGAGDDADVARVELLTPRSACCGASGGGAAEKVRVELSGGATQLKLKKRERGRGGGGGAATARPRGELPIDAAEGGVAGGGAAARGLLAALLVGPCALCTRKLLPLVWDSAGLGRTMRPTLYLQKGSGSRQVAIISTPSNCTSNSPAPKPACRHDCSDSF